MEKYIDKIIGMVPLEDRSEAIRLLNLVALTEGDVAIKLSEFYKWLYERRKYSHLRQAVATCLSGRDLPCN